MLKEINDQPSSISSNIDAHIKDSDIFLPGVGFDLKNIERVVIIACGTSYYSGMIAKLYYENIAEIPCSVEIASEFRYRNPVFEKNSLYIFISQSGETADTIAALNYVKEKIDKTSKTLAVVNVSRSTIATMCDGIVECFSGPEIGVASTKNFTCQTLSLLFLTLKIAIERGSLTQDNMMRYVKEIESLPNIIYSVLNSSTFLKSIDEASNLITKGKKAFYIGRNLLCAIAMEGALKLKELSYIPSEGFPAGELKHGPIALIDSDSCVIALSSASILKSKMQSSVEEVSARNGVVILICDYSYIPNDYIANKPSCVIQVSNVADFLTPIVFSIPVQMISYKVAKLLNRDVDKPRNLAKSVTVE
jgi:glucosamine--fructose-6-phosphate aminotransferase (isomerizing)